jgi:hypothetical protein
MLTKMQHLSPVARQIFTFALSVVEFVWEFVGSYFYEI